MKTATPHDNPFSSSIQHPRLKWHHAYFLLAAFAVFTVSFSLVLIYRLVATHKRAVEGNFQWVARLQLCDNLGKNAAEIVAGGTDAIKHHDADAASFKMRGALSDFNEKLDSLRDEMSRNVPPTDAAQLLRHCATVRKEIGKVAERSDSIFSLVRAGKPDEAGKQGVTLSRDYNGVLEELNSFRVDIRAVRKAYMEAQSIEASKLAAYEWWLGGLILVLVAGITIYGVKLERHMSAGEEQLKRNSKELEAANQRLATELAERQRLEDEHNRFFTLSGDILYIADFNGCFKRLNPAWEKTLGFTVEELMAKPFIEFVHPDDRAATLAKSAEINQGAAAINFENRYRHKDGSYRWLSWNAAASIEVQRIFAVARDITGEKLEENALQRKTAELERFNRLAVGREQRMIELKKQINALLERTGEPAAYDLSFSESAHGKGAVNDLQRKELEQSSVGLQRTLQ